MCLVFGDPPWWFSLWFQLRKRQSRKTLKWFPVGFSFATKTEHAGPFQVSIVWLETYGTGVAGCYLNSFFFFFFLNTNRMGSISSVLFHSPRPSILPKGHL